MEPHDLLEVDVGDGVARDHEEGVVEEPLRVLHASGRAERLVLGRVGEREIEIGSVTEEVADDARQELHGDHDFREVVLAKEPQDVQ